MILKKAVYLIITFTIGLNLTTAAQCQVKVSKNNNVVTVENPEHYIYERTDSSYTGISIHALYTKPTTIKKHELIIFYTSSTTDTISQLKFTGLDTTENIIPLKLLGAKKNDNKKQHTKVYQFNLTAEQITYFTTHPLRYISMVNEKTKKEASLKVSEPSFLAGQLTCLLNN
jgi:hypothetical protein